ncbi:MAG: CSLREA domain-containing protein, partial [Chloroflexota bacterium]|nr:CSLREA domain-containing protein [Chloroflexota bacterium]
MKPLCKRERIVVSLTLTLLLAGIGSIQQVYAATINVTTFADNLDLNGDCSLREAIQAANTDTAVDACPAGTSATMDTIQLSAGTYTLGLAGANEDLNQTGDLDITGDLSIRGVDASTTNISNTVALDRVIQILPNATVTLIGESISNGHSSQNGGAVFNSGTLTLHGVVIQNSSADGNGGGLFNATGTVTINDGTINNNQSHHAIPSPISRDRMCRHRKPITRANRLVAYLRQL